MLSSLFLTLTVLLEIFQFIEFIREPVFFLLFPYYCLIFNVIAFTSYVYYFLPYTLLWVYFVLLFYLLGKTLVFLRTVTSFVSIASILVLKFPAQHCFTAFWNNVLYFYFNKGICIFFLISFEACLTHVFFKSALFSFQVFGDFSCCPCQLISSLISLWLENVLCIISDLLNCEGLFYGPVYYVCR